MSFLLNKLKLTSLELFFFPINADSSCFPQAILESRRSSGASTPRDRREDVQTSSQLRALDLAAKIEQAQEAAEAKRQQVLSATKKKAASVIKRHNSVVAAHKVRVWTDG